MRVCEQISSTSRSYDVVRALLHASSTRYELVERLRRHPPDALALLRYAGDCAVTPALAVAIREHDLAAELHPDLAEALEAVLGANRERNERLIAASVRYASILANAGIAPVALKGVAVILESLHGDSGARMASDIDFLVPPAALADALVALRDAGCLQVGNLYDPRYAGRPPGEAPLDPADFRNDLRYANYHVPAIRHPEHDVSLELHTGVSPTRLPMGDWLDTATLSDTRPLAARHAIAFHGIDLRVPAPMVRLLHNFHHSQIKDRLGALGVTDWRHLLDARAQLRTMDDPDFATRLLERATAEGLGPELELHMWQLRELLGASQTGSNTTSEAGRRRIAAFVRRRDSASRARLARLAHFWLLRTRSLFPDELRRYYGPLSYRRAIGEAVHFRSANAVRLLRSGQLRRLAVGC